MSQDIIRQEREKHFDPEIVDAFFDNYNLIETIRNEFSAQNAAQSLHLALSSRTHEMEKLTQLYR